MNINFFCQTEKERSDRFDRVNFLVLKTKNFLFVDWIYKEFPLWPKLEKMLFRSLTKKWSFGIKI